MQSINDKGLMMALKSVFNSLYAKYIHTFYRRKLLKNEYTILTGDCMNWVKEEVDISELFEVKDESWNMVNKIYDIAFGEKIGKRIFVEDNSCPNNRVTFDTQSFYVRSLEAKPNRWVLLKSKHSFGNIYAVEFDVILHSYFTEFQFAFNYESIIKRQRFMHVNNEKLVFGIVERGAFIDLNQRTCCLTLGEKNKIRIEIVKNKFYYFINNSLVMVVDSSIHEAKSSNYFMFIFWEKGDVRSVKAEITGFNVFRGVLCS